MPTPNPPKGTKRPPSTPAARKAAVSRATEPAAKKVRKPRSDKGVKRAPTKKGPPVSRPSAEEIELAANRMNAEGKNPRTRLPNKPRANLTELESKFLEVVKNPDGTYRISRKQGASVPMKGPNGEDVVDAIPTTPQNRLREGPICGAPRSGKSSSGPGICCMPAGHSTEHPGYGRCSRHGGNSPTHVKYAAKLMIDEQFLATYGEPMDVTPQEALLAEVQRTAGHVAWLGDFIKVMADGLPGANITAKQLEVMTVEQVEEIFTGAGPRALVQFTQNGVAPSVWIQMYQEERKHLVRVSKLAIDAGVAERQIELAEQQAMMIAVIFQKFMRDARMAFTPKQAFDAKEVIRELLTEARKGSDLPELAPADHQEGDDVVGEVLTGTVV